MGFFSWTCAKTNLPIMASTSWDTEALSEATLLRPGKPPVSGTYDGYGRLGGLEFIDQGIHDQLEEGTAKLVLKAYGKESFESLGLSQREPGQGHFHDQKMVDKFVTLAKSGKGFRTYDGYALCYNHQLPVDACVDLDEKKAEMLDDKIKVLSEQLEQSAVPVKAIEPYAGDLDDLQEDAEPMMTSLVGRILLAKGIEEGERFITDKFPIVPKSSP